MMTGKQLGHYLVGEKLGEGGMGIVYMGTDTRLRRPVALKFLTRALPAEASERKRFLREARAASSVNHPNVCVIHAIEEIEGEEFIVMEFVEGVTLRKWARQHREQQRSHILPLKEALGAVLQVAEGLAAAHAKGIVHRDIKPENVMITAGGLAKIMDFGLAKLAGESRLTRTGATVGTVAYMSPEQVQGGEIDAQSDIYSLGVLFYELLADRTPFVSDHVMGMMYAIVHTAPEPLEKLRPGIDPAIVSLVMKCLAKEKKERVAAMGELIRGISGYEAMQRTALAPPLRVPGHGRGKGPSFIKRVPGSKAAWLGGLGVAITAAFYIAVTRPWENGGHLTQTLTPPDSVHSSQGRSQQKSPAGEKERAGKDTSRHAGPPEDSLALAEKRSKSHKGPVGTSEKETKSLATKTGDEKPAIAPLTLELVTNSSSSPPRFTGGERMEIYFRVNKPCTIRVLYHAADGTLYALTGPLDRVLGYADVNRRILIDTSVCSPPFGRESLHAFATTGSLAAISTTGGGEGEYCKVAGDPVAALAASRRQPPGAGQGTFAEKEIAIVTSGP